MAFDGADSETRAEMGRVLHIESSADVAPSFAALQKSLEEMAAPMGEPSERITLAIANRLFAQTQYEFRPQFFARLKENYGAAPETLDFKTDAVAATKQINDWVMEETQSRIRDLIPQPLDPLTRLVLANAIYLKAPWASEFSATVTKPEPFHIDGKAAVNVPTMAQRYRFRYAKRRGFTAVGVPYIGGKLQLLVLLPEKIDGLRAMERKLTAKVLAGCATMKDSNVFLHLPKFKFEPPTMQLSEQLQALGMKTAFDVPQGSANFDRMAPRKPDSYLAISKVFHKTFISVDEKGTEAAASTSLSVTVYSAAVQEPKLIEGKIDRPFVYAIQHVPSGTCLFIGRVTDPR